MKSLIALAIGAAAVTLASRYFKINSLNDVKNLIPDLKAFVPQLKNMIPKVKQVVS